jgi:hypothetical protein
VEDASVGNDSVRDGNASVKEARAEYAKVGDASVRSVT